MTSAETQGNALADWLLDNGRVPVVTHDTRAKIIEAIREAENAKLEEAAALAEDGVWVDVVGLVSEPSTKVWHGESGTDLAASIRSLIEKD